jgi:predicted nucleotidyltransferase
MNERIKLLIEQATTIEYGVDNGFDRVTFDKEKFAELVVKECSNYLWVYDPEWYYTKENQMFEFFGVDK